ncbi:hypothetical protein DPMN_109519 [Dreissena polymorpha]|uniref:Uncharacterized protein n=1 Tax=Dreissena polymorpha TaxID=45954 RepID=A0A9D4KAY1_DREPO|nr:hypothetical protein DPMN_109519 [Dreissena polymorpha]
MSKTIYPLLFEGGHKNVTSITETIFELNSCIKETNVMTKFHENWAKNVTSRVLTFSLYTVQPKRHKHNPRLRHGQIISQRRPNRVFTRRIAVALGIDPRNDAESKNAPPTGGHVFSLIRTIVELKNAPPTGGHVFSPIWTIFELVRDINKTNVLTNFHDDWTKIVTSRVFTRENCHYIHIEKNAPPTGSHVF